MVTKHLFILLACLFVVMIGFGITLPVLPFYVERLALAGGASANSAVLHVGLLTGVYALMQFIFAPVWGRWSDRIGRRPLILIGIAGYVIAQVLFALATSLWLLYGARIVGGILSSATLPVAAAYVADMTTGQERSRGMAWLGTATSLGVVAGPAFGGMLSRKDLHLYLSFGHFRIDSFSIPFFVAAFLGFLTLCAAARWLPESLPSSSSSAQTQPIRVDWRKVVRSLRLLLGLSLAGQFALAMFEGTFALYSQAVLHYGPVQVGAVFVVCGLVMTVFQIGAVGILAGRIREIHQIAAGFGLMGAGIVLLTTARTMPFVITFVALLSLGMSFIAPNLAALISKRGGQRVGTALGIQNAVNSLGQGSGPILGGVLFVLYRNAPYFLSGSLLVVIALVTAWKVIQEPAAVELAV